MITSKIPNFSPLKFFYFSNKRSNISKVFVLIIFNSLYSSELAYFIKVTSTKFFYAQKAVSISFKYKDLFKKDKIAKLP